MYEVAKRSAALAAATGGLLLVGVGCASADSIVQTTAGGDVPTAVALTGLDTAMAKTGGVVSGNNIAAPLSLPVNICGIAVLGSVGAQSCSTGSAPSSSAPSSSASTAASALGALSGNVVQTPLNLPIDLHDLDVLGAVADGGACSCAPDAAPAAAGTPRSDIRQVASTARAGATASGTAWTGTPQTSNTLAAVPSNDVWRPDAAEVAPAAQQAVAQVVQDARATVAQAAQVAPAAQKTIAQVAQAAQQPVAQAAATSTAMSSIAMDLPASVPMRGPAAEPEMTSAVKQTLLPAAATGGRLAETGVNVAPAACAGGAALVSGGALSTLAFKAKAAAEQL